MVLAMASFSGFEPGCACQAQHAIRKPLEPTSFLPGLFLSDSCVAHSTHSLLQAGIRKVLFLGDDSLLPYYRNLAVVHWAPMCPTGKHTRLFEVLPKCLEIIEDSVRCRTPLLVHCSSGLNLIFVVVVAALMAIGRMGLIEAITFLKERKPHSQIDFSIEYTWQLMHLAKALNLSQTEPNVWELQRVISACEEVRVPTPIEISRPRTCSGESTRIIRQISISRPARASNIVCLPPCRVRGSSVNTEVVDSVCRSGFL